MKLIATLALALLLLSGCVQQQQPQQNVNPQGGTPEASGNSADVAQVGVQAMSVEKGDGVKVEYVGKLTDGTIFDRSEGRGPLEFVAGGGQMIKGFDEAVIGMKLNDEKEVTIPPEKAYGAADAKGQRITVPLTAIGDDGNITIGAPISTGTGQIGRVIDINDGMATIEFKHQLAGKTLSFWIKVVEIKKKTTQ